MVRSWCLSRSSLSFVSRFLAHHHHHHHNQYQSTSGTSGFSAELIRWRRYSNFWRSRDRLRTPCALRPATSGRGTYCCYAAALCRLRISRRVAVAPPAFDPLAPGAEPAPRLSQSAVGTGFSSLKISDS